jgi:hypothetical protein
MDKGNKPDICNGFITDGAFLAKGADKIANLKTKLQSSKQNCKGENMFARGADKIANLKTKLQT